MIGRRVYAVDGYRRHRSGWLRLPTIQFASITRARQASVAAASKGGAVVYELTGQPEFDAWSEEELVERHGELPPESL